MTRKFNRGDFNILHEDGDIVYVVLTSVYQEEAFEIVCESFCDEPSAIHLEPNREIRLAQWRVFSRYFSKECASNGSSVICFDSTNGRVAGVFWVRDFLLDLPDDFSVEELTCISPVVEVLFKADASYHELRPNLQKGQCADLWMLGVSSSYRRRGIAQRLTSVARDWACAMGFSYVVLEASGGYSAKCAEKAGMRAVVSKVYAEENKYAYEGISDCHSVMRLFEYVADCVGADK